MPTPLPPLPPTVLMPRVELPPVRGEQPPQVPRAQLVKGWTVFALLVLGAVAAVWVLLTGSLPL